MVANIGDEVQLRLTDSTGVEYSLDALVAQGSCVLIFYRGHW